PMPSTTRSRSWVPPISRCRTTTGATGRRRRIWGRGRNIVIASEAKQSGSPHERSDMRVPGCRFAHPGYAPLQSRGDGLNMKDRNEIAEALAKSGYIADGELA